MFIYCGLKNGGLSVIDGIRGLIQVFLLQSWTGNLNTAMAYNGKAWFISALLFAYFMSPFLARLIKKPKKKLVEGKWVDDETVKEDWLQAWELSKR